MTSSNVPQSGINGPGEHVENFSQMKQTGTLDDLLTGCIEDIVSDEDPGALIDYEKDTASFNVQIKSSMRSRKVDPTDDDKKNKVDWSQVQGNDIDGVEASAIAKKVRQRTKSLIALRNEAFIRIKDIFPNIRNVDDWESKIQKGLRMEQLSSLRKIVKDRGVMKRFLNFTLGEIGNDILKPREVVDFKQIFHDLDTQNPSPTQRKEFEKMFSDFKKYQSAPELETLRELLFVYRGVSGARKKEILSALDANIPLSLAIQTKIVSHERLADIATSTFGALYTDLDTQNRDKFLEAFSHPAMEETPILLSMKDVNEEKLGGLFETKDKLNVLSEGIISRMNIERGSVELPQNEGILGKATKMFPNDTHHSAFIQYIDRVLRTLDRSKKAIDGMEKFVPGSIVRFGDAENPQYFRLKKIEDNNGLPLDVRNGFETGVLIETLNQKDGYITSIDCHELSYEELHAFFSNYIGKVKILSDEEFERDTIVQKSDQAGIDGKLFDATELDDVPISQANALAKFDQVDSEGRTFGFDSGTYFTALEEIKDGGKAEVQVFKVESLDGDYVHISSPYGNREKVSLELLYQLGKNGHLKRINKVTDDQSFIAQLAKDHGIAESATIENHQITQKDTDHDGKEKKVEIRAFEDDDGGHIRVVGIENGMVHFGEFRDGATDEGAEQYAERHGTKKAFKEYYQERWMTYGAFLAYLKRNKMKGTTKDIIHHDAYGSLEHGHDHSHMDGNFWSRLGKMQSFSTLKKGFEMIYHSIEHTLEKGSKLDAARFAMGTAKFLHLPDGIEAQLYADIVDGSKEIVEKIKNKIANLPGPAGRLKCIHIAHNPDARPEEVMAAIQFMVSGYGHLYAEDIRQHQSVVTKQNLRTKPQGYYAFLDAFIHTARLPPREGKSAIIYWREKAYEKIKPELGSEGEPPEESLLHALFKSIDGNPEDFPYAASVVKAIGGPGGFEKDWKFEGYKNAVQKGRDQTTMVNAQGRLNKAIGYLSTHEFYKAMGAMEKVAGKVKIPSYQALPFVWAVGGYTKYVNPNAIQDLKNYGENGLSFHAYSFLRKETDNTLYRDTVRLALIELKNQGKIGQESVDKFNSICKRFDHGIESAEDIKKNHENKSAPFQMMQFWQDHCEKGLHELLQNNNGWLTKMARENETVRKYREQFDSSHKTQLRDANIPGGETGKDWYDEHGLGYNLIMRDSEDGQNLQSLYSSLNKIKFTTTNRGGKPMEDNTREKIWNYLVTKVKENKDPQGFLGDRDLQKRQYLFWRKEILGFFNAQLNAGEVKSNEDIERNIHTPQFTYFKDMSDMGIDPRAVFRQHLIDDNSESDYQAWLKGGYAFTKNSNDVIGAVRGEVRDKSADHDPDFHSLVGKQNGVQWKDPDARHAPGDRIDAIRDDSD